MKIHKTFKLLVVCYLFIPVFTYADSELLNRYLSDLKTLQSDFTQRLLDEDQQLIEESSGTFQLLRPNQFHWHYQQPYEQEILSNGEKVWIYDPELLQASVRKLNEAMSDSPALLLSGDQSVQERFIIKDEADRVGARWVSIQPKSADSSFQTVNLGFKGDVLFRMEMFDNFGQTTQITFSNTIKNETIDQGAFFLELPGNVDIISDSNE